MKHASENAAADTPSTPIRIGVSACLLGQQVRYDGGHKHNEYLTRTLGPFFEFVPFCPEVAIGLGVPRAPIQLVRVGEQVRARGVRERERDVTDALVDYGRAVAAQLDAVSGYLFKKGSPSCGMERVKIYGENGHPQGSGPGVFAATIMSALPLLPVEEEGRLMDPRLRENFLERVFIFHRWQQLTAQGLTPARLVEFHTRIKFVVQAHDETGYRELGRLVADAGTGDVRRVGAEYGARLMQALRRIATPRRHANVLMHLMGFLKRQLARDDKAELLELIDAYRKEQVPLIVPITLLKHHLRKHPDPYVLNQLYLGPHPAELMLRNHI